MAEVGKTTFAKSAFRYPDLSPVGDSGLSGLGASFNKGGEGLTPWVDYIRFQSYRPIYSGKAILESFKEDSKGGGKAQKAEKELGPAIYLYLPSNIAVAYSANYNSTKFGVAGVAAAGMLGGSGSAEEVAKSLQNMAAGATPEAGFGAVASATNQFSQFIGTGGDVSGSDLAAVTQGRVFNPYEEQVFNGIVFRAHNFNWKLVARNKAEAAEIDGILKVFKAIMLPSYNDGMGDIAKIAENAKAKAAAAKESDGKEAVADKLTPAFSEIKNRYLNVPYRVSVEFLRIYSPGGKLGDVGAAKQVTGLFKMKDCIIDGLQVNYTPDGAYVNTNDGYVPAIELQLSLKEISLVTQEDVAAGY